MESEFEFCVCFSSGITAMYVNKFVYSVMDYICGALGTILCCSELSKLNIKSFFYTNRFKMGNFKVP